MTNLLAGYTLVTITSFAELQEGDLLVANERNAVFKEGTILPILFRDEDYPYFTSKVIGPKLDDVVYVGGKNDKFVLDMFSTVHLNYHVYRPIKLQQLNNREGRAFARYMTDGYVTTEQIVDVPLHVVLEKDAAGLIEWIVKAYPEYSRFKISLSAKSMQTKHKHVPTGKGNETEYKCIAEVNMVLDYTQLLKDYGVHSLRTPR